VLLTKAEERKTVIETFACPHKKQQLLLIAAAVVHLLELI